MDADKLKGMAVISIAEGTRLGRIDDILFDTHALRVAAILASGDRQTFVVPFEGLKNIGSDAVTVENSGVTQAASKGGAFASLIGLSKFKGLKVVDSTGTFLGTISAVDLDEVGGRLLGLTVHKGGVLGLGGTTKTIAAEMIRSVGPEIVTVATDDVAMPPAP